MVLSVAWNLHVHVNIYTLTRAPTFCLVAILKFERTELELEHKHTFKKCANIGMYLMFSTCIRVLDWFVLFAITSVAWNAFASVLACFVAPFYDKYNTFCIDKDMYYCRHECVLCLLVTCIIGIQSIIAHTSVPRHTFGLQTTGFTCIQIFKHI